MCKLGGSVRIQSASIQLRKGLGTVRRTLRENATNLFPRHIEDIQDDMDLSRALPRVKLQQAIQEEPVDIIAEVEDEEGRLLKLPSHLSLLANDLERFEKSLGDFPDFCVTSLLRSVASLKQDLKVCNIIQ